MTKATAHLATAPQVDHTRIRADLLRDRHQARLRRLAAGVMSSAVACVFRFRPPGTGSKRAGWRRSGAVFFAFFGAAAGRVEPGASCARLRFKTAIRSITGGGAGIS